MDNYNINDYSCPDCSEAKLQSDKNAKKINEVIDQVNTLIQFNNETVDIIEKKVNEILSDTNLANSSLKVRDVKEGESVTILTSVPDNPDNPDVPDVPVVPDEPDVPVVPDEPDEPDEDININSLVSMFDFTNLTSEDTRVSDIKNENKFFSLEAVEPSEYGSYALGHNGQLVDNPQCYTVGLTFRGDNTNNRTAIFRFEGSDGNTSFNFENKNLVVTSNAYYYETINNVPVDLNTNLFLLVGIDLPNDTMYVWFNGIKKATITLNKRNIGNTIRLNKGFWSDGNCIFNKIALFNKVDFNELELKDITEYMLTDPQYLYVDNSNSFISVKKGLVRHISMKNITDGIVKDIVYSNNEISTTSVNENGFVLSERKLISPNYSICGEGGGVFVRFDKTNVSDNQYLFNYDANNYFYANFSTNTICGRQGSQWIIYNHVCTLEEKNVLFVSHDMKIYLNGVYINTFGSIDKVEPLFASLKNDYPIKDYVWYVKELSESDIQTISTELCSY